MRSRIVFVDINVRCLCSKLCVDIKSSDVDMEGRGVGINSYDLE